LAVGGPHSVFISHSSRDRSAADAVCTILELNGVRCWISSRDLVPGRPWDEGVLSAIERSRVMVLLLTRNSNASPEVQKEVMAAVKAGAVVVPVRMEQIQPSRMLAFHLGTVQWLDAFAPPVERHLRALTATVQSLLGRSPATPPPQVAASAPASASAAMRPSVRMKTDDELAYEGAKKDRMELLGALPIELICTLAGLSGIVAAPVVGEKIFAGLIGAAGVVFFIRHFNKIREINDYLRIFKATK